MAAPSSSTSTPNTRPTINVFMAPNPRFSPYVPSINEAWHRRTTKQRNTTYTADSADALKAHLAESLRRHQPNWRVSLSHLERDAAKLQLLVTQAQQVFWTPNINFAEHLPQLAESLIINLSQLLTNTLQGRVDELQIGKVIYAADRLIADGIVQVGAMQRALTTRFRTYNNIPTLQPYELRRERRSSAMTTQRGWRRVPFVHPPAFSLEPPVFNRLVEGTYKVALNVIAEVWQVFDNAINRVLAGGVQDAVEGGNVMLVRTIRQTMRLLQTSIADKALDFLVRSGVPSYATLVSNIGEVMVRRVARSLSPPLTPEERKKYANRFNRVVFSNRDKLSRTTRIPLSSKHRHSLPNNVRKLYKKPLSGLGGRPKRRRPSSAEEVIATTEAAMQVDDENDMSRPSSRNKRTFR